MHYHFFFDWQIDFWINKNANKPGKKLKKQRKTWKTDFQSPFWDMSDHPGGHIRKMYGHSDGYR